MSVFDVQMYPSLLQALAGTRSLVFTKVCLSTHSSAEKWVIQNTTTRSSGLGQEAVSVSHLQGKVALS